MHDIKHTIIFQIISTLFAASLVVLFILGWYFLIKKHI
jgi:hypothetical protein